MGLSFCVLVLEKGFFFLSRRPEAKFGEEVSGEKKAKERRP